MVTTAITFLALVASAAAANFTVLVDTSKSTHVVDPLFMGAHPRPSICWAPPPSQHGF